MMTLSSPAVLLLVLGLQCTVTVAAPLNGDRQKRQANANANGRAISALSDLPATSALRREIASLPAQARAHVFDQLNSLRQSSVATDTSYHVDPAGNLLVVDDEAPVARREVRSPRPRRQAAEAPDSVTAQGVPIHHSRPSSSKKLFLNFQGEVVTNTLWNSNGNAGNGGGYSPITAQPYYGSGYGPHIHTAAQTAAITDIWMRVAEAFRPFDIDVTTEVPAGCDAQCGLGGSCRNCPDTVQISTLAGSHDDADTSPTIGGVTCPGGRCKLPGPTAGGIAYLPAWRSNTQTIYTDRRPAWTFNGRQSTTGTQVGGTTVNHEAGHNFGLGHDGISISGTGITGNSEYLQRIVGSQGTVWGPIMGAAFSTDVTQWSKGDYQGATRTQDDIAILTADFNLISDADAGKTQTTWPTLGTTLDGTTHVSYGIIKGGGESHTKTFTASSVFDGTLQARTQWGSIQTGNKGIKLTFSVNVLDPTGTDVCSVSVNSNFDAVNPVATCTFTNSPAGTYTVVLTSVQSGESVPAAMTNGGPLFTNYGSIGEYTMDLSLTSVGTPPPTTAQPTLAPTDSPTEGPTAPPTTAQPTFAPTDSPTEAPTDSPTEGPTAPPTTPPPTTAQPTFAPTDSPTEGPTAPPTTPPPTTAQPTFAPTDSPTEGPTAPPTTAQPTFAPTAPPVPSCYGADVYPPGGCFPSLCCSGGCKGNSGKCR